MSEWQQQQQQPYDRLLITSRCSNSTIIRGRNSSTGWAGQYHLLLPMIASFPHPVLMSCMLRSALVFLSLFLFLFLFPDLRSLAFPDTCFKCCQLRGSWRLISPTGVFAMHATRHSLSGSWCHKETVPSTVVVLCSSLFLPFFSLCVTTRGWHLLLRTPAAFDISFSPFCLFLTSHPQIPFSLIVTSNTNTHS